jgi:hypothetical protein
VAVDDIGACGSEVLGVDEMSVDAYVIGGADVNFVNWSQGNVHDARAHIAGRRRTPVGSP